MDLYAWHFVFAGPFDSHEHISEAVLQALLMMYLRSLIRKLPVRFIVLLRNASEAGGICFSPAKVAKLLLDEMATQWDENKRFHGAVSFGLLFMVSQLEGWLGPFRCLPTSMSIHVAR